MNLVASLIKLMFGTKSEKDRKLIAPYVEKILAIYPSIEQLSNDELRARSAALKAAVADHIREDEQQIADLKAQLENLDTSLEDKERISKQIDSLTETIDKKIEEKLEEILPEAFAIVKDTARRFKENSEIVVTATDFDRELAASKDFVRIDGDRAVYSNTWTAGGNKITWDMVHYDCQLFGGVVLHKGNIAEMATGEGKTLTATMPAYLNALSGEGVHVVTVNDYLARFQGEDIGRIFRFLGMSVGVIVHDLTQEERRAAYACDVTYGTNNEMGFDYLRDNMVIYQKNRVQRGHHFAIVDEVDSILIDEARTPLIISGAGDKSTDLYEKADRFVCTLEEGTEPEEDRWAENPLSDEELAAAESEIQDIYTEWQEGDATEDSFYELQQQYSDDVSSSGVLYGDETGAYTHIIEGSMVDTVDEWIFDSARQPGDTAIVHAETDSYNGYHLLYFIGIDDEPYCDYLAEVGVSGTDAEGLRNIDYNNWLDELVSGVTVSVNSFVNWFAKTR